MTEPDPRDLWPDKATLAAGDEDKAVSVMHVSWRIPPLGQPTRDYMNSDWPRARPYQEDGHLAASEYWKEHPNE